MATEDIRPDADITVGSWATSPLFSKINEVTPDSTVITASVTTTAEIRLADVSVMGASDICTGIKISAYTSMSVGGLDGLTCAYKFGATTSSYTDITGGEGSYSWEYAEWTGLSLTQAEVNDLRVLLKNTSYGAGSSYINTVFVTITYAPSGYSHKIYGIDPSHIAKINGIPRANVAKINGV